MDIDKRAIRDHKCPWCEAEKGSHCISPTGRKAKTHSARHWKVVIEDRMRK